MNAFSFHFLPYMWRGKLEWFVDAAGEVTLSFGAQQSVCALFCFYFFGVLRGLHTGREAQHRIFKNQTIL